MFFSALERCPMSVGVFDVASFGDDEEKVRKQAAQDKLAAATYDVREKHGPWLFGAHDRDAFHDRAKLAYVDICKTIEPHLHARLGVYKKVLKTLEREWREASTRRTADDQNEEPSFSNGFNGGGLDEGRAPRPTVDAPGAFAGGASFANGFNSGGINDPQSAPKSAPKANPNGPPPGSSGPGAPVTVYRNNGVPVPTKSPTGLSENAAAENSAAYNKGVLSGDTVPVGPAAGPGRAPAAGGGLGKPLSGVSGSGGPSWSASDIAPGSIGDGEYTVKPGDTLSNIAKGMGSDLGDLEKANTGAMSSGTDIGKNPDLIHPGDKLYKPLGAPAAAAPPAGGPTPSPNPAAPPPAPVPGLGQTGMPRGGRRYYAEFEEERDHPEVDNHSTYEPHTYDRLEPEGDFDSYKGRVDQGAEGKVDRDFVGPDSRSSSPYEVERHDDDGDHNFVKGAGMYPEFYRIARLMRADAPMAAPSGPPAMPPQGGPGTGTTPAAPSTTPDMAMNPAQPMMPTASREFQIIAGMIGGRTAAEHNVMDLDDWAFGDARNPYSGRPEGQLERGEPGDPDARWPVPEGYDTSRPNRHHAALRLLADRNYLQQADEALTKVLNEKAQEFQETIAPLQQALVTIQQAEQLTNPLNVSPPAGTVNVMPQQPGGAPQGGGMPQVDPAAAGLAGQQAPQQMQARRLRQAKNCECWEGYKRVPGTKPCAEGSCEKCDTHRKSARRRQAGRAECPDCGAAMTGPDAERMIKSHDCKGRGASRRRQAGNWDDGDHASCPSCGVEMPKDQMYVTETGGHGDLDFHCEDCADKSERRKRKSSRGRRPLGEAAVRGGSTGIRTASGLTYGDGSASYPMYFPGMLGREPSPEYAQKLKDLGMHPHDANYLGRQILDMNEFPKRLRDVRKKMVGSGELTPELFEVALMNRLERGEPEPGCEHCDSEGSQCGGHYNYGLNLTKGYLHEPGDNPFDEQYGKFAPGRKKSSQGRQPPRGRPPLG